MSRARVAVIAALPEEAGPLVRRLGGARRRPGPVGPLVEGRLAGREVVVAVGGDGARAARRAAAELAEGERPEVLIGLGVAGALSPELAAGDLLAPSVVDAADGSELAADEVWRRRALASPWLRPGITVTVDRVASAPAAKRELWRRHGGREAMTVDLESAAWAGAAAARRVPWLVLRGVSDAADEALPVAFERFQEPGGGVRRGAVARYLMLRPGRLVAALRLRRRLGRIAAELAAVVEEVLAR